MKLYGIKYFKNVKYANKKFYIDKTINNDIEDIDLYLDNYSFDNYENITCEKVYDTNPIFYCKTLHSCFAHAVEVLFGFYWAMQDINSQYKEKQNFRIFIREREYKLYPKKNPPLFDYNKNKLKGVWNDLLSSITNNDIIFEHTLKPNTSFFIKDLYIYIIDDKWQRSPWNCIDYYPDRNNIKIKDVALSDDILVPMLENFTSHIKTHFNVPLKITNTKKNIVIIDRKDDRRNKNIDNLIKSINKEKYNYNGILYLEDLSLKQQINTFVVNDIIIFAQHGSALIHIIWGKNNHIIEISRKDKENRIFQRICNITNNKLTQINKDNENRLINFISNI